MRQSRFQARHLKVRDAEEGKSRETGKEDKMRYDKGCYLELADRINYKKFRAYEPGRVFLCEIEGDFQEACKKFREIYPEKKFFVDAYHDTVFVSGEGRHFLFSRDEAKIRKLYEEGRSLWSYCVGLHGATLSDKIKPIWGSSRRQDVSSPNGCENYSYAFDAECLHRP